MVRVTIADDRICRLQPMHWAGQYLFSASPEFRSPLPKSRLPTAPNGVMPRLSKELDQRINGGDAEQTGVDAIEPAAMAGEERAAVFHPAAALQR